MTSIELDILGIGAWSPALTDWPAWSAALAGGLVGKGAARPVAAMLPPAERRRAPDGIAVALTVAREATAAATALDVTTLASVFASAYGDLAVVDYLCVTLADDPLAMSPTKFHLSIHNAAAGNWSIATRAHAASTSIAAGDDSVGIGLLEAATLVHAEGRPVLFVAFDTPSTGLLTHTVANGTLFGCALVLAPATRSSAKVTMAVEPTPCSPPTPRDLRWTAVTKSTPAARAIPLLEALVRGIEAPLRYPIGTRTALSVVVRRPEGTSPRGRPGRSVKLGQEQLVR